MYHLIWIHGWIDFSQFLAFFSNAKNFYHSLKSKERGSKRKAANKQTTKKGNPTAASSNESPNVLKRSPFVLPSKWTMISVVIQTSMKDKCFQFERSNDDSHNYSRTYSISNGRLHCFGELITVIIIVGRQYHHHYNIIIALKNNLLYF